VREARKDDDGARQARRELREVWGTLPSFQRRKQLGWLPAGARHRLSPGRWARWARALDGRRKSRGFSRCVRWANRRNAHAQL
jgi:hypothetical protein